jgi:two-component system LytT family response regulator
MEADGMYTKITTTSETEILISKPLKHFVELLKNIPVFYKPHRSYFINLKFIKQYVKSDGGYIVMDTGKAVSISKEKKEEFLTIVQNIG